MKIPLGRHVLGLAAVLIGIFTIIWPNFYGVPQIAATLKIANHGLLASFVAAIEIFGGAAIQWRASARAGAFAIGGIFFLFAAFMLPHVVARPKVFGYWDGFFEPLSQALGALIVWATVSSGGSKQSSKIARFGCKAFGVCLVSFTLAQVVYFAHTAELVPKWLPPGQKFWAIATTVAFALAALAFLAGRVDLLASRLLTAMILGFWVLVWLPISFATPHSMENWAENVVTLSVAGAAWVFADYLGHRRSSA